VCGVRTLRRLRGQCREGIDDLVAGLDSHDDRTYDERFDDDRGHHDDDSPEHDDDRTDDGDHRAAQRDDGAENRDDGARDADDGPKSRADDGLHSPDYSPGHHDYDVCFDSVRSGVLFLGP
jgi:hypothetical protein